MKSISNVFLIGFALAVLIVVNAANASSEFRSKPRTIRGFKNAALSTARGFGKRDGGYYQSLDSINDILEDARKMYPGDYREMAETFDSFPVEWFVEELANNPRLARLIVKKFIDLNQDGEISFDELLRNSGGGGGGGY